MAGNIKLALMSCCAPCSCGAIAELLKPGFSGVSPLQVSDFAVLFYNPNIFPESEYRKRLDEQIKYCESLGVKYAVGEYDHEEWLFRVRGLESEPERGRRCAECFRMRFAWGLGWARENGYDAIASVFGVSRHKSQEQVDSAAANLPIRYIPIDWDESLRRRIDRESDFYRQKYCGCECSASRRNAKC